MPDRPPLSVVIIAHNAATQLDACLASAGFADEVVVVDSGSIDTTREIAAARGARVVEQAWLGFGPQKQFAVRQARHDWVLCLDADERVSPELAIAIDAALAAGGATVYALSRCNRFMGRYLRHGEGYPDWNVRLFHRAHARWSDDAVHEQVVTGDVVVRLRGDLLHESAETLSRYLEKQNRYTDLQAEALAAGGRSVGAARLVLSPLARFLKFYFLRLGFLDGVPGLVHIAVGCWNSFMKYAKAIALRRAI